MFSTTVRCLSIVLGLTLTGCGASPKLPVKGPTAQDASSKEVSPKEPSPTSSSPLSAVDSSAEGLLRRIPSQARLAVVLRPSALKFIEEFLSRNQAMRAELVEYLIREVGVDPTALDGIVLWVTNPGADQWTTFARIKKATTLKGRVVGQHRGINLLEIDPSTVAAAIEGGVLVGSPPGVATAIDTALGGNPSVSPSSPLGFMLPACTPQADILVGVSLAGLSAPLIRPTMQMTGVHSALFIASGTGVLRLKLLGEKEKLHLAESTFKGLTGLLLTTWQRNKEEALRKNKVIDAVGAIIGYHQLVGFINEIRPRIEENALVMEYRLPQFSQKETLVMWVGIGAAISIPAVVKHIRRSKAAEARENVRKIAEGARAYYEKHHKQGTRFSFPKSTDWTPSLDCCARGGACPEDPSAFSHQTWKLLGFSVTGTHRYQYRFTSDGKGPKARFIVEARGDLNCDGVRSSFKLTGRIGPKGTLELEEMEVLAEEE